MKLFSFRNFRVLFLLIVLAAVAIHTKGQRLDSTSWIEPLELVIYPINADGSDATNRYIGSLSDSTFKAIDEFMAKEGRKYKILEQQPVLTRLGQTVTAIPPQAPAAESGVMTRLFWSLRMRLWVFLNAPAEETEMTVVRMFVLYQQGREGEVLSHSVGIQKGLYGVVHAYALNSQSARNSIVIAHELMHTVGATDKYGADGASLFPDGFAQPERNPLYPQFRAEIMSGRIPVSATRSKMAKSLKSCVVGAKTASEIGWLEAAEI